MSCKPCTVGEQLVRAEREARQHAAEAFKGNVNSMVGLGYSEAACAYARTFDLHVRLDHCDRCGSAYSETFTKEMAAAS